MTRRVWSCRTIPDHASRTLGPDGVAGYRLLSELAHGGTATVYLAEHCATGQRVAIKALDASFVGHSELVHGLLGEHELARRTRHPGLLDVVAAEQTEHGIPYLVMELLDGETLRARIDRRPLSIAAAIAVGAAVAGAVAALHRAGVIHGDLKPDNLFVLPAATPAHGSRIKVIDYGVARLVDEPARADGAVVGTPAYMPPEQWRGAPVPRSDVYALGCTLYELVIGAPPFVGAVPQLLAAHRDRRAPPPRSHRPELPTELDALISAALAKAADARPAMAELEAALARLADSAGGRTLDDELPAGTGAPPAARAAAREAAG